MSVRSKHSQKTAKKSRDYLWEENWLSQNEIRRGYIVYLHKSKYNPFDRTTPRDQRLAQLTWVTYVSGLLERGLVNPIMAANLKKEKAPVVTMRPYRKPEDVKRETTIRRIRRGLGEVK